MLSQLVSFWSTDSALCRVISLSTPLTYNLALFGYCLCVMKNLLANGKVGDRAETTWLHQLLLTVCAGFGGGVLVPIFLAQDKFFPYPIGSDIVFPFVILVWGFMRASPATFRALVSLPPIRLPIELCFEALRAKLIFLWAARAFNTVPASILGTPLFAPFVCGTLGGCGGMFLVHGLACVRDSIPWVVESALTASLINLLAHSLWAIEGNPLQDLRPQLLILNFLVLTRVFEGFRALLPWRLLFSGKTALLPNDQKKGN